MNPESESILNQAVMAAEVECRKAFLSSYNLLQKEEKAIEAWWKKPETDTKNVQANRQDQKDSKNV